MKSLKNYIKKYKKSQQTLIYSTAEHTVLLKHLHKS